MWRIFAILLLRISAVFACPNFTSILNETIFKSIISDGRWHLTLMHRPFLQHSMDAMVDTDLYTELAFSAGFPSVCRIEQRCTLPFDPRRTSTGETFTFNRTAFLTASPSGRGPLLTFAPYRTQRHNDPAMDIVEFPDFYSYVVYKYIPNKSLVLFTCESRIGLLILRSVRDYQGFWEDIGTAAVLKELQISEISANNSRIVIWNEQLQCPEKVTHNLPNCQGKNSQRAAALLAAFFLQIFWNSQTLKFF